MKTNIVGAIGESSLLFTSGQFSVMIKARNAVKEAMDIFPKNIKTLPTPDTNRNLSVFFKMRMKAFIADGQKL